MMPQCETKHNSNSIKRTACWSIVDMTIMETVPSRRNCCIFMNDRIQHVEVEIGGWCGAVLENMMDDSVFLGD